MFIGVSSYSFSRLVQQGQMNLLDVVAQAKAMGFDAIEFSGLPAPEGETALACPARAGGVRARGLPVVSYTIGADFLNGEGGGWQAEAERLKDEVRVAHPSARPACATTPRAASRPGTRAREASATRCRRSPRAAAR